jgi:hypothetical protein
MWNIVAHSFYLLIISSRGRNNSVGIATRHGQEGPGIEFRWGRDFLQPSRLSLGPTQPPIQWVPALFPRAKAVGAWPWLPIPSSAEVKERVELHLYSTSVPSWHVLWLPLPLIIAPTYFGLSVFMHSLNIRYLKLDSGTYFMWIKIQTQIFGQCKMHQSTIAIVLHCI